MSKRLLINAVLTATLAVSQQLPQPKHPVNGHPTLDAEQVYPSGEKVTFGEAHGVHTGWISTDEAYFLSPVSVTETRRQDTPEFVIEGTLSAKVRRATSSTWQVVAFTYLCNQPQPQVGQFELARIQNEHELRIGEYEGHCKLKTSSNLTTSSLQQSLIHQQDTTAVLPTGAVEYDSKPTVGPARGWLVIQGGGLLTNEVKERFVALAGGANANFVVIPTALTDAEIEPNKIRQSFSNGFRVSQIIVLHTRDRVRANSEGFVEPLRHASGVWIDGGRQWRLADAYLGTAVEREIKALLARGGVVGGGSAGATIQGSYLVRGAPEGNEIMMAPGHEMGFGLLAESAIDQHVDARGREKDLDQVIAAHPNLLGIGIDQGAAIVVHGDLFAVVGGQVAIHDGKDHDGALYYFLSPGQTFNLKTRAVEAHAAKQGTADSLRIPSSNVNPSNYPLLVRGDQAQMNGNSTMLSGQFLDTRTKTKQAFQWSCAHPIEINNDKGLFPAKQVAPGAFVLIIKEVGNNQQLEVKCESAANSLQPTVSSASKYPLTLTVTAATRYTGTWGTKTSGAGLLASKDDTSKPPERIIIECDTGVFSRAGNNIYPARINKPHQLKIEAREIGSDKVRESTCKY